MQKMIIVVLFVITLVFAIGCCETEDPVPYSDRKIAIIYNENSSMWEGSAIAVKAALEPIMSREIEIITTDDLNENINEYLVIVIAGCENPNLVALQLGEIGMNRIRNLVADGGAFIGIGGGAYLAGDSLTYEGFGNQVSLIELFSGVSVGPNTAIGTYEQYGLTIVNIDNADYNPDQLNNLHMLYRNGPSWQIDNDTYFESVARYLSFNNSDAAVQFEYGDGRVALIAVHPEIEEQNPAYDGGLEYNQEDPESDWFMIQTLARWCLRYI